MPQFSPTNYEGKDRLAHIEDFLTNKSETTNRQQLAWNSRALLTEAFPLGSASTAGGTQSAVSIVNSTIAGFRASDVVTNIICLLTSEGGTLTSANLGLWDTSGNLLATTANLSTAFTTTSVAGTIVVGALTSPYTITLDAGYYLGFVGIGNIGPKLASGSAVTGVGKQVGTTGARFSTRATAQSAAGSVTVADSAVALWFAAS